jgi:Tol biopolymer transport system component
MASGGAAATEPGSTEAAVAATEAPVVTPIHACFVSTARNLYAWADGAGTPTQLTASADVSNCYVSQDGSLIAFVRNADYFNYQLDAINFDGTNQRTLLTTAQIAALPRPSDSLGLAPAQIAWIPGTHTLALNFKVLYEGPGLAFADPLYLVDGDTGSMVNMLSNGSSWKFGYSPDGIKLWISRPTGVDLYTSGGVLIAANAITYDFVNTASEYAWVASPFWSADGSSLAVAIAPAQPWGDVVDPSQVYVFSAAGAITSSSLTSIMQFSQSMASFDPGLTRVAYTERVGVPADNNWALHVSNLDGTGDAVIATGYINQMPIWSPDGAYYIYTIGTGSTTQTYLGVDGGSSTLLAGVPGLMDVRWIDDSRYIVSTRMGTASSLMLGALDGTFGVIFNDPGPSDMQWLAFDVNR